MAHRSQLSCLNQVPVQAYHSHSLTPSSHTPVNKMVQPTRTSSQDSTAEGVRKRVCKACDRCRLKKSKCDGSNPCTRCKTDNAICVFGERKKSQDKVYPKGYVEQLEQQQSQLVSGLVMLYEKLEKAGAWEGASLDVNAEGKPYTHCILQALDLLDRRPDGSTEDFEEDPDKLQDRLIAAGAGMTQHHRRGSFSSESELSQHSHARTHSHGTPMVTHHVPSFKEGYKLEVRSEPTSPPTNSARPRSNRHSLQAPPAQPSPLQHNSPLPLVDDIFTQPWPQYDPANDPKYALQPNYAIQALQAPSVQQPQMGIPGFGPWDTSSYPSDMDLDPLTTWQDGHPTYDHGMFRPPGMDYPDAEYINSDYLMVQT